MAAWSGRSTREELVTIFGARGTQMVVPAADVEIFTRGSAPADETSQRAAVPGAFLRELDTAGVAVTDGLAAVVDAVRDALAGGPRLRGETALAVSRALPAHSVRRRAGGGHRGVRGGGSTGGAGPRAAGGGDGGDDQLTTDVESILATARTFLVVDWPGRDVPDSLARAGYEVVVHGGPGPEEYTAYELSGDAVVERRVGRPPAHADVVYTYRPLDELPEIVAMAQAVGAGTVWVQSGRAPDGSKDLEGCWMPAESAARARAVVEAAGLVYVDAPYIAGAVRSRG